MRYVASVAVAFALVSLASVARSESESRERATTILIVRHAERPGQADSLSEAGFARANTLAHVAGAAGVKAIYHSDTKRTRLTAQPLADALGITPIVYPAKEIDALVARIFADHDGETVLVVGHSNTVAKIVVAAGGPPTDDLADTEFDKLFVVATAPCRSGPATLVILEYGERSP